MVNTLTPCEGVMFRQVSKYCTCTYLAVTRLSFQFVSQVPLNAKADARLPMRSFSREVSEPRAHN
jgi:hypothetical protein